MPAITIVTGATGRLGQRVVARLVERSEHVRVLTRHPQKARDLWGDRVDVVAGDFAEPSRLAPCLSGADRLFLLSPISEKLATYQKDTINAAATAGIERIVKISGSDWTLENADRSISGAAHAEVEAHLKAIGIAHTAIRPNAWMQVSLAPVIAAALRGDAIPVRYGGAAVSFIDAEDIADVAVQALVTKTPLDGPLVLTGEQALTSADIAGHAAGILKKPVELSHLPAALPAGLEPFERRAIAEFAELIGEGQAATVTDTVERITGHPPRSIEGFLARHLSAASIAAHAFQGEKT